ncbi:MAG: hypothetical protein BGO31_07380 [Bacteroidetes bacterium 43-16]|nr:MAG: hypothetical protein BGO31_07380 [Bacteroidetes bacterium 43-16]
MDTINTDNFPALSSRHSRGLTFFIKGFGWFFSVFIFVCAIVTAIMVFSKKSFTPGVEILQIGICLLLLLLFGWLILFSLRKSQKNNFTRLVVDINGICYYNDTGCIKKMLFVDLKSGPDTDYYDVFLNDPGEDGPYYLLFYLIDSTTGKLKIGSVDFNTQTVIINSNKIHRHFIKGIQLFRPDLRIAPGVLDLYRIEKN